MHARCSGEISHEREARREPGERVGSFHRVPLPPSTREQLHLLGWVGVRWWWWGWGMGMVDPRNGADFFFLPNVLFPPLIIACFITRSLIGDSIQISVDNARLLPTPHPLAAPSTLTFPIGRLPCQDDNVAVVRHG